MIPTLTLGIPGSSSAAIFLGGLMMYGIRPGMDLFKVNGQLVWALIFGLIVANIVYIFMGALFADFFAKITLVPVNVLIPLVLVFCFVGAYSVNNNMNDVIAAMVFGLIGYMMVLLDYPAVPAILALILGPIAEKNYFRSMLLSDGSFKVFFSSTISVILVILIAFSLALPFIQDYLRARRKRAATASN